MSTQNKKNKQNNVDKIFGNERSINSLQIRRQVLDKAITLELIDAIRKWHHDRNLINGSSDKDQFCKLMQEAGELSDSICKGKDISDDIGDMLVVLINIMERNNLSLKDCLAKAWNDIKDRKGKMINGVFVKESDL